MSELPVETCRVHTGAHNAPDYWTEWVDMQRVDHRVDKFVSRIVSLPYAPTDGLIAELKERVRDVGVPGSVSVRCDQLRDMMEIKVSQPESFNAVVEILVKLLRQIEAAARAVNLALLHPSVARRE